MTATQEDMIAELQRANVELQQRLDAALAQRNSEFDERIEQQAATIDVLRAMSASPGDTQPVFDLIVRQAQVQCDSASAALYEFDGMIHCRSFASGVLSSDAIEAYFRQFPMPLGQASNHALTVSIREQRIVHVRDAGAAEEVSTISRGQGVQSAIVVPLMTPSGAVGCIALSELRSGGYSRAQVALLQTFAEQAVIAIASAETYRALQTRTADLQESLEYQTATSDVLKTISRAAYDLDTVLTMLLVTAERLCGANHGQIWRKDGDAFRYAASHMNVPAYREKEEQTEIRTGRGTLVGRVGLESRPVLIADAWNDPEYEDKEGARLAQARSMLGVPLLRDGQLIGAFALARRAPIPFTDRQVDLVRAFADQAVIAMENARLLGELRERTEALAQRNGEFGERIEQQSATIDVLKVMSSTPDDTQPVFQLIVRRAQELCNGVGASLIELEGNLVHFRATHSPASHSNDPAVVEAWKALFPMVPTLEWLSCRAILEKREVHIRDLQADPGLSDIVRATNSDIRSHLTVPLMRDGQAIGSISLRGKEAGGFTDSQVALLRTFAEQAVIAIGSVANFRALRERTAELAQRQAELRVTFENMGDGVAMFDKTQHLVAWNRKFQDILDVPDDIIARRQTFSEYVHYLAARGEYDAGADPEEHVRGLIEQAGQSRTYERTRPDGRAIEIRHNPVPGGGFVLIYADITERKHNEAEIRAARDAAEEASRTIEAAYRDLKAAQANLIQAEKMASLGQLTAGIAHEIKNPLNFVNNFAALSVDLLSELKETAAPGFAALTDDRRADIDDVSAMLTSNLEKITEHGKRADGIVKAMLEHSRGSSAERRAVDLNALIDEALNLVYHGARAQDQSFNITLERDFGDRIAPIEVNPQDVTRVFLNLFSNGFYAATRRARNGADAGFVPTLRVATCDTDGAVEVRVRDNGTGIPADIRDKLFQPFFTTKPTGEGTGLGLSITYDIVTQQHGGRITVESEVGQYSEFTVRLPRHP